jgi:hypothetical protein
MRRQNAVNRTGGENRAGIQQLHWWTAALCCGLAACSSKPGTDSNAISAGSVGFPTGTAGISAPSAGIAAPAAGVGTTPIASGGTSSFPTAGVVATTAGIGATAGVGARGGASGTAAAQDDDAGVLPTAGTSGTTGGAGGTGTAAAGCTRENLKAAVDAFYAALASHSTDKLALAANVKYTENAKTLMPGEGVWKTAGMVKFKRSAVDTTTCMTATESVIPDGTMDRVYGVRLKLDAEGKISEIEALLVLDYILIMPQGLVNSKSDDWETVLPPDKQTSRDKLQAVMDKYLKEFPSGACGFASSCTRLEDGGSVGTCVDGSLVTCNMNGRPGAEVLKPRLHVIDVEAGISVGFTIFLGGYDDFHLFKVRDGQVTSVHAVLTQTSSKTGWE